MVNALYTIDEIRRIEQAAMAELPPSTLMQRAGHSAAELALSLLPEDTGTASTLVLAGPGNNGGDALEMASILAMSGIPVSILLYADAAKQSPEARQALQRAKSSPVNWMSTSSAEQAVSALRSMHWALVVDGLFGIGLKDAISGHLHTLVEAVNMLSCPVLSLDNPSGLNTDTGNISEEHEGGGIAVKATHTITFIGDKPGLHTLHGRDHAGRVHVADLNISTSHFPLPRRWLNNVLLFATGLRKRKHESHKGSYGNVAVLGGAQGMTGAPVLTARAALHCGAGRVLAVFPDSVPAYDSSQPELMYRAAHDFDYSSAVLVVGPGLGRSRNASDLLARALDSVNPVVIDADALNLVADDPSLQEKVARRTNGTLMTPHPLEAARLLGVNSASIQADRINAASRLANRFNAVVVLKGSGTIVAAADGKTAVNPTGNPGLATAGSGDVLSGICGALLAQNWPLWETALGSVWMHGTAADDLVAQGIGPIGLTAGELIPAVRTCLNRLTATYGL